MTPALSWTEGRIEDTVGGEDAAALLRELIDGRAPIRAGITGPGGAGKSTLLHELAVALRAAGVEVVTGVDDRTNAENCTQGTTLLVDDAEHLSDDEASALTSLVRADGPHIVLAFRPWPRSDAVARLVDRFGRERPHLVLQYLSVRGIRRWARVLLGDELPDEEVQRVLDLTGGSPRFVDHVLLALRDDGWDLRATTPLPATALERLRHRVDRLDPELRDFIVALAVGFSASGPALAMSARFAGSDLRELMTAARASGVVSPDGALLPIARITVLQSTPAHELWPIQRELVDAVEAAGVPLGDTAVELARHGFRDPRVAEALRSHADDALPTEPVEAWHLYAACIEAGSDVGALAGRRAQAAWSAGDVRAAERLLDGVLTPGEHPDLPRVMKVAGAVWARKGMLRRAADAYAGLAETADPTAAPLAAMTLAMLGEPERSRSILAMAPEMEYPTSSQLAVSLTAEGILDALEGAPDRGLSALLQASSLMNESDESVALPEVPAVLAAHVALNAGELGIAVEALRSATDAAQGGPAFRNRLRLTHALVALRADDPARARALLETATSSHRPLGLRDEVLAHSVRIGLARRTDDLATLVRAWNGARQTVVRMPIDLTALPALAELAIAAARLHESHFVAEPLERAWALLDGLGRAASWSTNLHWAAVQAAILRNDGSDLAAHSTALRDHGEADRVASRLAEAGDVWASALAGDVDLPTVEHAVRDLALAGYPWDASRLAGHAAARAADHQDTLRLLAVARHLHPEGSMLDAQREQVEGVDARHDDGTLSPREREVARLVLEGRTYAEIGASIYISPRTAEHHIARIRRRLGVTTRSDLLARLRVVLDDEDDAR
ncbi:LuxR family transcriptional regulator [Agromyces badenianii]|uniref:LuxR family transcriptional regulator n=1 Tax=Agromyces badenianii TaxID=2080742 RepID=A0A2S0WVA8_9MICO|nr:helix-turn-helix transcriptional regulator [Agromyces badenianii]AWB95230.1 LuxR family transcriptional regulator [Agromyces badenianii]